jgi:hypothetical protein
MSRQLARIAALAALVPAAACSGGASNPVGPTGSGAAQPQASTGCSPQLTLDLGVGQTAPLTSEQAACFRLAAHSGARYVLAGFDGRAMDGARQGPEPSISSNAVYVVGDGSGAAPQPVSGDRIAAAAAPAPVDFRADATTDPASPFSRATPWSEGDALTLKRVDTGAPATAHVVKVMGRFALALVDADRESHTDKLIGDTEKALGWLISNGVPVLDNVWGAGEPSTSPGSGQVLIVFTAWDINNGAGATATYAAPDGGNVSSFVWLNLNAKPGTSGYDMLDQVSFRLKLVAHELTHAWQMRYAYTSQPAGPRSVSFGPAWAMEGTADLVSMDLVRRYLGVGLTSNWKWESRLTAPNDGITLALEPTDTRGRLSRGYYDAASFLQDVQVRMVRHGADADEALAQVARGAVDGWYGVDAAGVRRQGLTDRVRGVLGPQWEPAEAVLLWTLTQAADDQTDAPDLNNAMYADAGDASSAYAWKGAIDEVQAGKSFAYQVTREAGSSFFVRVRDDGRGGTVALSASVDGTRWMIARLK